jgi:hypothetical protein
MMSTNSSIYTKITYNTYSAHGPLVKEEFAYRTNDDGTVDIMCLFCFEYIGLSCNEESKAEIERKHACLPKTIARSRRPGALS